MKDSFDFCSRKQHVVAFGGNAAGSNNSLGAIVAFSVDGFDNHWELRDLTRGPDGSRSLATSLSFNLLTQQWPDIVIYQPLLVDFFLIMVTSVGIFRTRRFDTTEITETSSNLIRVRTGLSLLDNRGLNPIFSQVKVRGRSDCFAWGHVFIIYATTPQRIADRLIFASSDKMVQNRWSKPVILSQIPGLDPLAGYGIVDAMQNPTVNGTNIYLIGTPIDSANGCGHTQKCRYNNTRIVIHGKAGSNDESFHIRSIDPSTEVFGFSLHANGVDIFIYGTSLWQSVNGGESFMEIFRLPQEGPDFDYFENFVSSPHMEKYALKTNRFDIYYGRADNLHVIHVHSMHFQPNSLGSITIDELGRVSALLLVGSNGSLVRPNGTLPRNIIRPMLVPLYSEIVVTDEAFDATLVPIFLGQNRVRFRVYSVGGSVSSIPGRFQPHHVEYVIAQKFANGRAVIREVSDDGTTVDCFITFPMVAEDVGLTPAVQHSLKVDTTNQPDASGNIVATLVLKARLEPITINNGWQFNDVGKTVFINAGSIVITKVLNSTVAEGHVIARPISYAVSEWALFNFREYVDRGAASIDQVLSIQPVGSSSLTAYALLTTGSMNFRDESKVFGMVMMYSPPGEIGLLMASFPIISSFQMQAWVSHYPPAIGV
ncbi:hypothetical protein HK102_008583 [Quaeritorhiza haematococci]|nr:hypothetical protein HK102_008583 [Quaeritorhiza haematococci]